MEGAGERLTVLTESGRRIDANGVVAGIGIQPMSSWPLLRGWR